MFFLFENFNIFLIVYAAVLLDTVFGIIQAKILGVFRWAFLPGFINNMITYTVYLMFGNVVEHFAKITGFSIEGMGIHGIAFVLILVEGASIQQSILQLKNKPR